MSITHNDCKKCNHKKICKYIDEYTAAVEQGEAIKNPQSLFNITIRCSYFTDTPSIKDYDYSA